MSELMTVAYIQIAPEHDPAVIALANEAVKLMDLARARTITKPDDLAPATEDLSLIAKLRKALTEKRADYLRPIKGHIEAVNAAFSTITAPLEEADRVTRDKVKAFRAEVEARRQEAEEINRQKEELARREAAFSGTGETTVDTTPVIAPAPVRQVTTDSGSTGIMKVRRWEVADFSLVPNEFKLIDAGKVTKLVKAGGSIPGIKVWEEETVRVTTR